MNGPEAESTPVVVLAVDEPIASSVRNALGQVGIASVLWLPGSAEQAPTAPTALPGMLIMQAGDDVGGVIREGVTRGWLAAGMPVILIAPDALEREQRRKWLEAGAWEIVRLPLDEELFGLQVRNFLRGRSRKVFPAAAAYSREALVKVTEENLSLARRYGRPLAIAAFGLDWGDRRADANAVALLERLAATAHEATRRSDLVGVTPRGTLLTLLPDTDRAGAQIFTDRLAPRLEARLREWGVLARVLRGWTMADEKFTGTAEEFLRAAEDAIS